MPQQLGGLVYLQVTALWSHPPAAAALTLPLQTCSTTKPLLPGESKLHRMAFSQSLTAQLQPWFPALVL